jgi:hypothetical protein
MPMSEEFLSSILPQTEFGFGKIEEMRRIARNIKANIIG